MSLVRWDPVIDVVRLEETMRGLWDGALSWVDVSAAVFPVDVYETGGEVVVRAALPGVKKEDVQVQHERNTLIIRANRLADMPEGARVRMRELPNGEFTRAIELDVPVDADRITATYADGCLTVRLPKAEPFRTRVIEIRQEP
jgi:HSP20 family protein